VTEPAGAAAKTITQQLIEQLTKPLNEAAKAFGTKVGEALAKDVERITKSFKEAHPAITRVTEGITGFSSSVGEATGSVAKLSGDTLTVIKNTRELRAELTKVLDRIPALDGLRLRFMQAGDAIRNMNLETIKSIATTVRETVVTKAQAVARAVVTAATKAWTIAQRAFNLVMSLNPIGLVITAITLLVAAIVLAYQRSTTFRNIVNAAFSAVRNVALAVFNAIRHAVSVVWPYISRVIQIAVTVIRAYVTTYFTVVKFVITTVFNAVRAIVVAVWNTVRNVITGAVSAVVGTIQRIRQVYTVIRDAFDRAKSAVGDAIRGVVDFVKELPGRALRALGDIKTKLLQSGKDLIQGFINGIRDAAGGVISAIKNFVLDKIAGPIKRFLGIGSPSRLMAEIGLNVGEGLVVGIDDSRDLVARAMEQLVPIPQAAVRGAAPATINVYPQPGQSEYEIGRVAARELAWAGKS
jgi:phage-related protein